MSAESPIYCVVSQGYIESGIHGLIAAKKLGIPLLSYIPFGYSNKELHSRFARIRDLFAGYIFNIPDAFITISSAQRVLLDRFTNNHTPIYVIPNPAEFNTSDHIPRIDWPPSATLHIGVIGRILFQQKNQNICIDVARLLNKRGFRFHFHIVGDGPDLKRLRQLVNKHSLDSDITLHGWMDNSDLPSFLSKHLDMLLIPSHYEGVPLIMLEALYYGIPFLVSDRHFVHEYNLPCNMLTDPRSAKDIASKLIDFVPSLNIDDFRSIRTKSLELHSHDHYTTAVKNTFAGFSEFIRSN
jgi:glycosyltransferase involved in cell wall biosynthesis